MKDAKNTDEGFNDLIQAFKTGMILWCYLQVNQQICVNPKKALGIINGSRSMKQASNLVIATLALKGASPVSKQGSNFSGRRC